MITGRIMRTVYIQDPVTHKLIPKEEYKRRFKQLIGYEVNQAKTAFIQGDIEPFISPIDKSIITSKSSLREHNRKHGVTDIRDYGSEYFERKHKERSDTLSSRTCEQRKDRINDILKATYKSEFNKWLS